MNCLPCLPVPRHHGFALVRDSQRYYLVAYPKELSRFENLVGRDHLDFLASSGGKLVFSNHPFDHANLMPEMRYLSAASKNALAMAPVYR